MKRQEFQKHFVSVHRLVYCGFVIELSAQGRKEPDTWVSGNTVAPSWRRLAAMPKQDGQSLERGPHTAETAHTWAGEPLPLFEYTQTCKAVHVPPLLNAILAPKAGSELLSSDCQLLFIHMSAAPSFEGRLQVWVVFITPSVIFAQSRCDLSFEGQITDRVERFLY